MSRPTKIDIAAGGLLESGGDHGTEIAIIHRARYDDWTLPKGHLEPGESLEQAALREVEEETGCTGEIAEIVSPIAYLVNSQPKIVVYYRMTLVTRGKLTPDDEVSGVEWVSPADAVSRLTYMSERDLVSGVYGVRSDQPTR